MHRHIATAVLFLLFTACAGSDTALHVRAIQHESWWELRYPDGTPAANEIHIPAGRTVTVDLALDGVGMIWFDRHFLPRIGTGANVTIIAPPGDVTTVRAIRFREPHTSGLQIIADAQFDAWLARQRSPAAPPRTAEAARGKAVFLTARCTHCHTVRGVERADDPQGPDLTHEASRAMLAAGTLPNRKGYLAGWIVNPEILKPGNGMPENNVDPQDLQALVAFLRGLK